MKERRLELFSFLKREAKLKALKVALATVLITFSFTSYSEVTESKEDIKKEIMKAKTDDDKLNVIYNSGKPLSLNNYFLNQKDVIKYPGNLTPEEGAQYVPQTPEFIDLYLGYIENGMKPVEAIFSSHVSKEAVAILKKYKEQSKK